MPDKQQMYWFYQRDRLKLIEIDDKFKYFFFNPTIFNLKLHKGSVILYFFWYIFSLGRYRILYIVDENSNTIAHYSHVLPKIFKYSFMKKQEFQIANCYTDPKFRGERLFSFALSFIGESFSEHVIWVGTRDNNNASIKSIERAGFKKAVNVSKTSVFGIYKLNE